VDRRNSAYFADKSCRQILVKFFWVSGCLTSNFCADWIAIRSQQFAVGILLFRAVASCKIFLHLAPQLTTTLLGEWAASAQVLRCPCALDTKPVTHVKTFCCDLDIEKWRADKTMVTTTNRIRFDCNSTTLRAFEVLHHDRRPTCK